MKDKLILDVAALGDSDNVGAYLRDAVGNLITSTNVGGKQSLDVNVAQSALPSGAATEATLATRASESTLASRASESTLATRASEATLASRASEATLAAILADTDKFQFISGRLQVDAASSIPNGSVKSSSASVTSVAAALLGSQLAGRKRILIENLGQKTIYIGAASVSIATGYKVSPGSAVDLELGPSISVFAVTESGSADVRVLEIA